MQKIIPCLWFDGNGEEAVKFYTAIFPKSRLTDTLLWGDVNPAKKGQLLTATFELDGQSFMVLNGGPEYKITPAISLIVTCETQEEVDYYWDKLLEGGGQPVQCGWLTDRFGVSWQVTPMPLIRMFQDKDAAKAARAMAAMMKMIKLDIATVKRAFDGE
ncbi:VOC family protein [Variovorax sp. Root473]|jgi:two-component system sensor histidine kinase QseC|uniref:VOC family protein n=1 Tax=Variovorax sp. Root473 TaxID=1736541 RepID=UPI0006F9A83F|nr:VOC family protein [Variovorax sp. Root473]KQX87655.1 3-demethylubiquinone-9 3-methyltransferase [Variovorax sp. Root473]